jgi:MerR family Zn(II)-responsive transcriptional regulator of zntA
MIKKDNDDFFQIGELSKKAEVSKRTIRYYEEKSLLSPSRVTSGGFRLYSNKDLKRLKIIKQFKKLDFSLDQIKEILKSEPDSGKESQIQYSRRVIETQLTAIQKQIENLKEMEEKNQKALEMLNQCQECNSENCPEECSNREAFI